MVHSEGPGPLLGRSCGVCRVFCVSQEKLSLEEGCRRGQVLLSLPCVCLSCFKFQGSCAVERGTSVNIWVHRLCLAFSRNWVRCDTSIKHTRFEHSRKKDQQSHPLVAISTPNIHTSTHTIALKCTLIRPLMAPEGPPVSSAATSYSSSNCCLF